MELEDLLDKVTDEKTFLEFANALYHDKKDEDEKEKIKPSDPYGSGHNEWENNSIASYLECCIAWSQDTKFGNTNMGETNNAWQKFARFLFSGKFYE